MKGYPKRTVKKTTRRRPAAPPRVEHGVSAAIGDAPITITLSQLDAMRADIRVANERAAKFEQDLVNARSADPSHRIGALTRTIREGCLPVVRFALANLPPSEIPKWPVDAVKVLAAHLAVLPDATEDDRVLSIELEAFAGDIEEHNFSRAVSRLAKSIDALP